ncbi:MAG: hypothetical protein CTY31_13715 [Hyphomicrobium sp.]|nr:MAG: hypothetical protein CTY31_13715 [Hyphomicrobium sp.]
MTAEIIDLSLVRLHRTQQSAAHFEAPRTSASAPDCAARFHFWTGASGKRYVHTVYSLFDCPPLDAANYVLVRREGKAARAILAIGRLTNETATLNLAEIRQRAALLGADEVHIHLLATSVHESHAVETDLRSAQVATLSN